MYKTSYNLCSDCLNTCGYALCTSCWLHEFQFSIFTWLLSLGSLSNHDDEGNKNPTNLHIWQWKTVFLHALHVHISTFDILKTWNDLFRSCVDDVTISWQMFNFVFLCPKRWFQFNSRIVRIDFSSKMTLNNWKMIAETRSYIFRWRIHFRGRRVCSLKGA